MLSMLKVLESKTKKAKLKTKDKFWLLKLSEFFGHKHQIPNILSLLEEVCAV